MVGSEYLWPGRFHERLHISTRQYARTVRDWATSIGLEASAYGTHSMRRTKVTQIYKTTGNFRAVQLLLGHTKMDSTVRYLGVELEDALAIAEAIEICCSWVASTGGHDRTFAGGSSAVVRPIEPVVRCDCMILGQRTASMTSRTVSDIPLFDDECRNPRVASRGSASPPKNTKRSMTALDRTALTASPTETVTAFYERANCRSAASIEARTGRVACLDGNCLVRSDALKAHHGMSGSQPTMAPGWRAHPIYASRQVR